MATETSAQQNYQVRKSKQLVNDINILRRKWDTTTSDAIRRAVRLAAVANGPEVEDVYMVKDGKRKRLPNT